MRLLRLLSLCSALILPFAAAQSPAEFLAKLQSFPSTKGQRADGARLEELFTLTWDLSMVEYPEWATNVGYPGQDGRWTDLSPESIERRRTAPHSVLAALQSIDRSALSASQQVSFDLALDNTKAAIEGQRFPDEYLQVTQLQGLQIEAADLLGRLPVAKAVDLENQLARLKALPVLVDQTVALLRQGLAKGITPPRVTLRSVPDQALALITDEPLQSPLLAGFAKPAAGIPAEEHARLVAQAEDVYRKALVPSLRSFHAFLKDDYVPGARESTAASALPDGEAWYAFLVKRQTTTDLTPKEIHEIGLKEVARITQRMEEVKASTGFKGTLAEFFTYLRTEPKFYYTEREALLTGYRDIAKRADAELPKLFRTLPRTPYGVRALPTVAEGSAPAAFYYRGSLVAGRSGYFVANTGALETRPKWSMEALTLHEAVPGHHLQISIAQELEGLPKFRTQGGYTAYVEGWGLYAEKLGEEMGFYTDPYSKFGQLMFEIWRAVRLVVDTGVHSLGWTREQAIDYFRNATGQADNEITIEVDRYIVWPGQALAYKLGELRILSLRAYATRELGDKFDLRDFHDQVLNEGALPLNLLESNIHAWVESRR